MGRPCPHCPSARSVFVVYFLEGTDTLTRNRWPVSTVSRPSSSLPQCPEVQVIGHADQVGSVADIDILARTRADS